MMEYFRLLSNNILFKIIFSIFVIFFIFTGTNSFLKEEKYIAKIGNKKISCSQFETIIQNILIEKYEYPNFDCIKKKLRKDILFQLIDTIILDKYLKKIKLYINNEQFKEIILLKKNFLNENIINHNAFNFFVKKTGLTPDQYIYLLYRQLLVEEWIKQINNASSFLPYEIEQLMSIITQTRFVRLIKFDTTDFLDKQVISFEEIKRNYEIKKRKYFVPENFRVEYIKINKEEIKKKIIIKQEEIQNKYNENIKDFLIPCRKKYSIIQCKNNKDANFCLQKLKNGFNFSRLAKYKSIDAISSKNGGDIGWINDNYYIEEIKKANLKEKLQFSDVIISSSGYFIIRLDDIQKKKIIPLNNIYSILEEKIKEEKSIVHLLKIKKEINYLIKNNVKDFLSLEKVISFPIKRTNLFNINTIPKELDSHIIKKTLLKSNFFRKENNKKNFELVNIDENCIVIFRIVEHNSNYVKSLKNVYKQIEKEIRYKKAFLETKFFAEKILLDLKNDKKKEILKSKNLKFSKLKSFDFIDRNDQLSKDIFQLPKLEKLNYGISTDSNGNIVIISLEKITQKLLNKEQYQRVIKKLNEKMNKAVLETFLLNLRKSYSIKINMENL